MRAIAAANKQGDIIALRMEAHSLKGSAAFVGAVALAEFRGVLLVFAGILLATSAKILLGGDEDDDDDPSKNAIVRWVNSQSLVPATDAFDSEDPSRFFTIDSQGIRRATPLLAAVACLELSDVVFAVDSVPAVFGVSEDPFIVYTSNMFAILGLRAWYGVLARAAQECGGRVDAATKKMKMPDQREDGRRYDSVRAGPHRPTMSGPGDGGEGDDASHIWVLYKARAPRRPLAPPSRAPSPSISHPLARACR